MRVTKARLDAFKEAYKMDFGEEISSAEALEMLCGLVELYVQFLKLASKQVTPADSPYTQQRDRDPPHLTASEHMLRWEHGSASPRSPC
jgi:hypothetical protein